MNDNDIRADSFVLEIQNIRIYRIQKSGTAAVYWFRKDDALRYARELQSEILRNKGASHER